MPFLSVVVRPRGQRCQNKISFDRLQPEQIKQDEVKSFEFCLFICIFIYRYVYLFLFMCIYFFLCIFISFYFLLFLFISFHFCLLLFISLISLFWRKKENDFRCVFWSSDHPNHVVTNLLQPAPALSLADFKCECYRCDDCNSLYHIHTIWIIRQGFAMSSRNTSITISYELLMSNIGNPESQTPSRFTGVYSSLTATAWGWPEAHTITCMHFKYQSAELRNYQ